MPERTEEEIRREQDHAALIANHVLIAAKKISDEVYLTTARTRNTESKKTALLQYVITTIISIIAIVSILTFNTVRSVQLTQDQQAQELVRIKTVQDNNTAVISTLNARVSAIELNQIEVIKSWVEINFVRKDNK